MLAPATQRPLALFFLIRKVGPVGVGFSSCAHPGLVHTDMGVAGARTYGAMAIVRARKRCSAFFLWVLLCLFVWVLVAVEKGPQSHRLTIPAAALLSTPISLSICQRKAGGVLVARATCISLCLLPFSGKNVLKKKRNIGMETLWPALHSPLDKFAEPLARRKEYRH